MMSIKLKSIIYLIVALLAGTATTEAQTSKGSTATKVSRNAKSTTTSVRTPVVTTGTANKKVNVGAESPSADVGWSRMVYRQLDLDNDKNAALYYPELPTPEQENLFRIILRHVVNGEVQAYEYLDGREVFTPEFQISADEMLARFHIPYSESQSRGIKSYKINDEDVPSEDVLSYYLMEEWVFDNVKSHTSRKVLALCPVLHQSDETGEDLKYPMMWVEMESLRPYLANTAIFIDDNDNTPRYSYNDFFTLSLYEGDIYKTRNVRNKSMNELYPDELARKHASDSIHNRLKEFDKALWSPSREEVLEARKAKEELAGNSVKVKAERQSTRRITRSRGIKPAVSGTNTGSTVRSVRDRK